MTVGRTADADRDRLAIDAEAMGEAKRFAENVARAIVRDPAVAKRLRRCGTDVAFRADDGDAVLRVLPTTVDVTFVPGGDREAPTLLSWQPGALDRFAAGACPLATAILLGDVQCEGPVGPILASSPILAGLCASGARAPVSENRPQPLDIEAVPEGLWAVEGRGIHKRFGSAEILRGVDLTIPEGAITVILGPSGTGKSVLLKHIIGLLEPDAGDIVVHGRPLGGLSAHEMLELRRRFGVLFQDGALFGSMSLFDNVAFPLRQHTTLSETAIARIVERRLDDVGLKSLAGAAPGTLSGGQRKRAGLARALVLQPDIVVFDEPDSGLDPVRTSLLSDLVLDTHPQYGGTYVVITHDIALARKLADYIVVLWQGRVVEAGVRDHVLNSADPFVRQFLSGQADGPLGMD